MAYNSLFKANPAEGLVIARINTFYRKPERGIYGVSDQEIYERGFLNFNFHPDQWGGPSGYTHGFRGTKVNGLPVRLMPGLDEAVKKITEGKLFPAAGLRSRIEGKIDGAILLSTFSIEQIRKMGLGYNTMYDMSQGQPFVLLEPEIINGDLLLKIIEPDNKTEINPFVRARFNSEGYLFGNDGEFYIPTMLSPEDYRHNLQVFRPNKEGEGFSNYWAKDIPAEGENNEGKLRRFYP